MYKKLFVFLSCLLICLLACSCKANSQKNILDFFSQETVRFKYMETEYEYNTEKDVFTYLSGDYNGMRVCFAESGCIITYGGFSLKTQPHDMPHLKAFHGLYSAFENYSDSAVTTDDGAYALLIDSWRFLVYYNKDAERIDTLIAETENGVFEYTVLISEETD